MLRGCTALLSNAESQARPVLVHMAQCCSAPVGVSIALCLHCSDSILYEQQPSALLSQAHLRSGTMRKSQPLTSCMLQVAAKAATALGFLCRGAGMTLQMRSVCCASLAILVHHESCSIAWVWH